MGGWGGGESALELILTYVERLHSLAETPMQTEVDGAIEDC